jgi:riboflavin transporter FmnP
MVKMGVLAALSIVLMMLIHFPIIPAAAFLEYEPADVPILIGGFLFGPLAGFIITVVVALIQAFTVSAASGWVGFVMHVIATGTLVMVSSFIYKHLHTFKGAIAALAAGALCMTLVMIPSNLFFSVRFFNIPYDTVKGMLLTAIIPFNLIKAVINSVIVILVYKSAGKVLRGQAGSFFKQA